VIASDCHWSVLYSWHGRPARVSPSRMHGRGARATNIRSLRLPIATLPFGCSARIILCAIFGLLLAVGRPVFAAPKIENDIPPRLDTSISNGLAFLAKQQSPDGAFETGGTKVATTSLSILAFLAAGQSPDLGKYGLTLHSAVDWLLSQQTQDGYFGANDRGMYSHAMATLALAELYGVEGNPQQRIKIHAALEKAAAVIITAQNATKSNPVFIGGWRYDRNAPDSDLSLSGWNVLALRAAQDVGITVPPQVRKRALEFVLHCYDENAKAFAYQPGSGAQAGDTAIGVLCLYLVGAADNEAARVDGAFKYLDTHAIDESFPFVYYATFYITQAAFQRDGTVWTHLGRASLERLIRMQDKDGGWPQSKAGQEPGRVYATAMAVQSLCVPYRLLPSFQR
jgi:hypothetical protein